MASTKHSRYKATESCKNNDCPTQSAQPIDHATECAPDLMTSKPKETVCVTDTTEEELPFALTDYGIIVIPPVRI